MSENALPTLDDVARAAGVSTATVSRCLNRSHKVSKPVEDRIKRAVEQLGYTPNFNARALAAKRTFTIGAIIPTMENAIFARGLQAFQETLNEKGYTLLVSSTGYDPDREAEQIKTLVARGADGLLLIGYARDAGLYEFLETRRVPFLLAWAHRASARYAAIGFDNCQSMTELTRLVLQNGHRQIAVISGVRAGNDRAADRVKGIHLGLEEAGIDPASVPMIETPYSVENGATALTQLMEGPVRPSVVMCVNDVLAAGAMVRAREMGIDIPHDMSITGFDDIELARLVSPRLTTVHVPHRLMGSLAAEELITMVETKEPRPGHRLDSSIMVRESLAKPPERKGRP